MYDPSARPQPGSGIWDSSGRHLEAHGKLLKAVLGLQGSRSVLDEK